MGVATSVFSRDATSLAENLLGGEGRADDLSFLLFRLKDMGEDVTPGSGVDSRPHRECVFVQACHQALGSQASALTDGRRPTSVARQERYWAWRFSYPTRSEK